MILGVAIRIATGAKSLIGSYGRSCCRIGLIVCVLAVPCTSVYPSGGDFAASCNPMAPLAPARLSMIDDWPHASVNFWPIKRMIVSPAPPGENGTMMRIGFDGYDCVGAVCATAALLEAAIRIAAKRRACEVVGDVGATIVSI